MTPSARVQAAIDLVDAILAAARGQGASADTLARNFFRERRYMGSGDRRAVRDLAWRAVRRFGEIPDNGRAAMAGLAREDAELAALFDGSGYGPAALADDEPVASGDVIPGWIEARLPALFDAEEKAALLDRAALDLRYDPARTTRAALSAHWPEIAFSDALPRAARLPNGTAIEASDPWLQGAVDVQDWGSQAIVQACLDDDAPALVIDLCAGAGGKTLALSAMLPGARIIASDTSRDRLAAMEPRRRRAGSDSIETLLLNPKREWESLEHFEGQADVVLVDAPCSGSGTWRRNPETRWRLTPERLDKLVAEQARLIEIAKRLVRPGGALVYAVCSLLPEEGARQVARGLCDQPGWHISLKTMNIGRPVRADGALAASHDAADQPAGMLLTPHHDGTDGFFFTRAIRS
ncbi:MAG: RsmB/NOP family class I SAM-dependent RNA methyltransferase [Blastomonas sp.]|uniref:RsmB/NOP family class I SAM-dependent RNA methyltransferase n=1 Tax=Blastomonas sp. TaxID=1909299 RepID=UPI00258A1633|nr:RsmB/NOP family class I SAM-dependent RNA methyltransferase [Blastomonas sp.]MCO5793062.1 RsmB/NOP family class I SAM-dependent RNA methyltransferase [Blastomonas sp.]